MEVELCNIHRLAGEEKKEPSCKAWRDFIQELEKRELNSPGDLDCTEVVQKSR